MGHLGKYVYCIVRCSERRVFDDIAPIAANGPVHTLPHNGLAVVVSDSPENDYESTRANMLAHERVQERLLKDFTLLPVRFGTVARPPSPAEQMQRLLEKRFHEFDRLLTDMHGKVELGLKVLWRDEKAIFEELMVENAGIAKLHQSIAGRLPQSTYFERIRIGEMVKNALERKRSNEAHDVLTPFRRIACSTVENQIIVDRMIVNAAFLVDTSQEARFDQAVAKLDEESGSRVVIKYIGPVPFYDFVNVTVNWQEL